MKTAEDPIEIDPASLSRDAIRGIAESFVSREGTDYGLREKSWEEKVDAILRQIESGEAAIVFDRESETVTLIPRR